MKYKSLIFFSHFGVCHSVGFLDGAGTGTENDRRFAQLSADVL